MPRAGRGDGWMLRTRTPPVPWTARREYIDDDVTGDDFLARVGLRKLMDDLERGDDRSRRMVWPTTLLSWVGALPAS